MHVHKLKTVRFNVAFKLREYVKERHYDPKSAKNILVAKSQKTDFFA